MTPGGALEATDRKASTSVVRMLQSTGNNRDSLSQHIFQGRVTVLDDPRDRLKALEFLDAFPQGTSLIAGFCNLLT